MTGRIRFPLAGLFAAVAASAVMATSAVLAGIAVTGLD
jgi:hypothetical protein